MPQSVVLSIVVDLIIVGLVAAGCIVGAVRGFIKSVMKPVRIALAFLLSIALSNPVSKAIVVPMIGAPLNNKVQSYIIEFIDKNPNDELPTLVKFAASLKGIDLASINIETVGDVVEMITEPIVAVIALVITFFILYFVFVLLIRLAFWFLEDFLKDTSLTKVNKIAGIIFNGLLGMIFAWCFCIVFDLFVNIPAFEQTWVALNFKGGIIYRIVVNLSPIEILLSF